MKQLYKTIQVYEVIKLAQQGLLVGSRNVGDFRVIWLDGQNRNNFNSNKLPPATSKLEN